ncbi:metalloprotease, partial [Cyathus striatus]
QLECGTFISTEDRLAAEEKFQIDKALKKTQREACQFSVANVYFHVIAENNTVAGGWLPDIAIENQFHDLNQELSFVGLQWTLAGIDRMINETWLRGIYQTNGVVQMEMKQRLGIGNVSDLNIYTVGYVAVFYYEFNSLPVCRFILDATRYSTFPFSYEYNPIDDGVIIRFPSLPGGTGTNNNMGEVAVHEVGHWVGLYHTFVGGCDNTEGDFVADMLAECLIDFIHDCSVGRDTCPGPEFPGEDPIHNHMDYTEDSCRAEFTPGQIGRMRDQLMIYRNI